MLSSRDMGWATHSALSVPSSSRSRTSPCHGDDTGSNPVGTAMLTVAQLVEHWIVIPTVEGSSPFCRPIKGAIMSNNQMFVITIVLIVVVVAIAFITVYYFL